MNERTATFLSFLFHPLLMPCVVLAIMLNIDPVTSLALPLKMKGITIGMAFITTVLIPLSMVFLIYRLGVIRSIYMRIREERAVPLLMIAVFYYLTYHLLRGLHLPGIIHMYMLGATLLMILLIIVNFFMKVSLHMAGLGAFTGLLTGMSFHYGSNTSWWILGGILLSGIVGTARMKLNAHQPSDLYTGWLMGALIMFLIGYLF